MEYSQAHGLAGVMLVFSFVVLLGLSWLNRRIERHPIRHQKAGA
jgi:ABC-type molybdate transport system permease subunit